MLGSYHSLSGGDRDSLKEVVVEFPFKVPYYSIIILL